MSFGDSQFQNPQSSMWGDIAARAEPNERASFIKQTYLHLAAAVLAFCGLEAIYLNTSFAHDAMQRLATTGNLGLIIAFGLFIVASTVARSWANGATSIGMQYAGLALYVVVQSFIFIPILYYAAHYGGENVIPTAGL